MAWPIKPRPGKTLLVIRAEIDKMYPGRDISSDGMLGNAEHAARESDHNPDDDGVVKAIDISHDPKVGFDSYVFARKVLAKNKDNRIKYVISNKQIMSGTGQGHDAWVWRQYNGANDHTHHVHISIKRDEKYFDDVTPWDFGEAFEPNPDIPTNPWDNKPVLVRGSVNDFVKIVQEKLGLVIDGKFGKETEAAVRLFQSRNGLDADGKVGKYTWEKLYTVNTDVPQPVVNPDPPVITPTPVNDTVLDIDVNEIGAIAQTSAIAKYGWGNQGKPPIGYIKGLAVMYAVMVQKLAQGDKYTVEAAKPMKPGTDNTDALAHYSQELARVGLHTEGGGLDTLRALFVLMMGLGMRESSGVYTEGRDVTAKLAVSADTAEAGLFQMSYDLRGASGLIDKLLDDYQTWNGFREVFAEGVRKAMTSNYGSGRGALFQKTCKEKPGFSVECAAIGLRNRRTHWGPINRKEAEVVAAAVLMFRDIEHTVKTPVASATPVAVMRGATVSKPVALIAQDASPVPVPKRFTMNTIIWPIIRYGLIAIGTLLASKGYFKSDTVPKMVDDLAAPIGSLIAAGGAIWGIYVSYGTRPVPLATAMRKDVPTISPATGQVEPGPKLADKAAG